MTRRSIGYGIFCAVFGFGVGFGVGDHIGQVEGAANAPMGFIGCVDGHPWIKNIYFDAPAAYDAVINMDAMNCGSGTAP